MKSRHLLVSVALFACMIFAAPVFAAPIFVPIDPIVMPPIFTLNPCFGATVIADMGDITISDGTSDGAGSFYGAVYTYDISVSGATVAHVITNYKRVDFGTSSQVAMDDTFIDIADGITVFGRSVNRDHTGIIGVQGVIIGAVNFSGTKNDDVKGRYLTTNFGGTNRFCAFLE